MFHGIIVKLRMRKRILAAESFIDHAKNYFIYQRATLIKARGGSIFQYVIELDKTNQMQKTGG